MPTAFLKTVFEESPGDRRNLVMLLYVLVTPAFSGTLLLLAGMKEIHAVIAVLLLCTAGFFSVFLRPNPTKWDWIFPAGIAPVVCCGVGFHALGIHGIAFMGIITAPLAWAAVLFEGPAAVVALLTSVLTVFVVTAVDFGLGIAIGNTFVFFAVEGLVGWVLYRKTSNQRMARLESLARHNHEIELTLAPDGRILHVNDVALKAYGHSLRELRSMNILDLRSDHNAPVMKVLLEKAQEPGGHHFESVHRRKDGSTFPVEVHAHAYRVGGALFMHSLVQDISERKKVEKHLRDSETFNRAVVHQTPEVILIHRQGLILFINDTGCEKSGYKREQLIGRRVFDFITPESQKTVARIFQLRAEGKDTAPFALDFVLANGDTLPVLTYSNQITYIGESATLAVLVDVSAIRKAEGEVRAAKEQLSLAVEGADLGLWDWNVKTGSVGFNDRWATMLGYLPGELAPHLKTWEALVHPEDWPKIRASLDPHLKGLTPAYESEHRMKHKDGSWVWVLDKGKVVERDGEGGAVRALGTHLDITTRQKQQALVERELERKKRDIRKAQAVQRSLNPTACPVVPDLALHAAFIPCEELSGDVFDLRLTADRQRVVIVMGDATGHGIATSMDATVLKMLMDRHGEELDGGKPEVFLTKVNQDCPRYLHGNAFPSLFAAVYDRDSRRFTFASAGAPMPLVRHPNGTVARLPKPHGMLLNFEKEMRYESLGVTLSIGDLLLFFSDALVEVFREDHLIFELPHLIHTFTKDQKGAGDAVRRILDAVEKAGATVPMGDDLTMVTLRVVGEERHEVEIKAASDLDDFRIRLWEVFSRLGWMEEDAARVMICLGEGVKSVQESPHPGGMPRLHVLLVADGANALVHLTHRDAKTAESSSLKDHLAGEGESHLPGRGLWLLERYADGVYFSEDGLELKLSFEKQPHGVFQLGDSAPAVVKNGL